MSKPKNETTASAKQNSDALKPEDQNSGVQTQQHPVLGNGGNDGGTAPAPAAPASDAAVQNENGLLPLAELAQRHRVPTWQQAALHTLMSWEDGKMVTDEAYQSGLARLSGRRMGGM